MDVHIDRLRRHLQAQEGDRKAAGEQEAAIGLAQGVLQRAIANEPPVEQQILRAVIGPAVLRIGAIAICCPAKAPAASRALR